MKKNQNFENPSIFDRVIVQKLSLRSFWDSLYIYINIHGYLFKNILCMLHKDYVKNVLSKVIFNHVYQMREKNILVHANRAFYE